MFLELENVCRSARGRSSLKLMKKIYIFILRGTQDDGSHIFVYTSCTTKAKETLKKKKITMELMLTVTTPGVLEAEK